MNRNTLAASLAIGAALIINGCAGAGTDSSSGNNTAGNSAQSRDGAANTATATNAAPAANAAPVSTSAGDSANSALSSNSASTSTAAATSKGGNSHAQAANMPKPQIGSGGNDFSLFTQARAALSADAELKGANVVVEAKEGVLTLSGAVASTEQKARAEQLARGVSGVKLVKNQLRVSGGN